MGGLHYSLNIGLIKPNDSLLNVYCGIKVIINLKTRVVGEYSDFFFHFLGGFQFSETYLMDLIIMQG